MAKEKMTEIEKLGEKFDEINERMGKITTTNLKSKEAFELVVVSSVLEKLIVHLSPNLSIGDPIADAMLGNGGLSPLAAFMMGSSSNAMNPMLAMMAGNMFGNKETPVSTTTKEKFLDFQKASIIKNMSQRDKFSLLDKYIETAYDLLDIVEKEAKEIKEEQKIKKEDEKKKRQDIDKFIKDYVRMIKSFEQEVSERQHVSFAKFLKEGLSENEAREKSSNELSINHDNTLFTFNIDIKDSDDAAWFDDNYSVIKNLYNYDVKEKLSSSQQTCVAYELNKISTSDNTNTGFKYRLVTKYTKKDN